MRRKFFSTLVLILHLTLSLCQDRRDSFFERNKGCVEYFTQKLQLTYQESQSFWPIYTEYLREISVISINRDRNIILNDERILFVKKKFRNSFKRILKSNFRVNILFIIDREKNSELR